MEGKKGTAYSKCAKDACEQLKKDFHKGKFKPHYEADIKCYLYDLCIRKGCKAANIHSEVKLKDSEKLKIDLVLGRSINSVNRALIEIKAIRLDRKNKMRMKDGIVGIVERRSMGDAKKVTRLYHPHGDKKGRRKPCLVVFLHKGKKGKKFRNFEPKDDEIIALKSLRDELQDKYPIRLYLLF